MVTPCYLDWDGKYLSLKHFIFKRAHPENMN